jgi:hypothetical protein
MTCSFDHQVDTFHLSTRNQFIVNQPEQPTGAAKITSKVDF